MKRTPETIGVGTRAARRMFWRLQRARDQAEPWRPITLHWRRSPRARRLRCSNASAGSWTSLFAPRIVLHFRSSLTAVVNSTSFATTRSIVPPKVIRHDRILHRETLRQLSSREKLLSQSREPYSTPLRLEFLLLTQPQRPVDAPSRSGSVSLFRPLHTLLVTAHSTALTARVSNSFVNHAHHAASPISGTPPAPDRREPMARTSLHSAESSHVIHRTELVWRQPQADAKAQTHDVRRTFLETAQPPRVAASDSPGLNEVGAKVAHGQGVPTFDASQMDRLVENVIQRVEKRGRIERERRGW